MKAARQVCAVSIATTLAWLACVGSASAAFGVSAFDGATSDASGNAFTQAGGHPFGSSVSFDLNQGVNAQGELAADGGALRNVRVDLPPGLIGNPTAAPVCPGPANLTETSNPSKACPLSSLIGFATLRIATQEGETESHSAPVFNMNPPPGVPAEFAFAYLGFPTYMQASLRSDGDYGASLSVRSATQGLTILGSTVTLWGTPANSSHDSSRCLLYIIPAPICIGPPGSPIGPSPAGVPSKPLIRNPTACTPPGVGLETDIHIESYGEPSQSDDASFISHEPPGYPEPPASWGPPVGPTGCDGVPFTPAFTAQPTTQSADSPSGLDVTLSIPQPEAAGGISQSDLKGAVVTLPPGMTVNPASAGGLGACSSAQLSQETAEPSPGTGCPLTSKIGSVTVDTPLLASPLDGSVFLASQGDNPFGSLLAIYIVVRSPERGVVVKLSGHVEPGPDGQLVTRFDDNPQLPFSSLRLRLKGGPRAPLKTPPACGSYTTQAQLVPWARPESPAAPSDSFQITSGPDGGPCPNGAFDPKLNAGTVNPVAGRYSPFVMRLTRDDGDPQLSTLSVTLPKGLLGKLKGIPYCADSALAGVQQAAGTGAAQLASPSCPAASRLGTVTVGAGAGSNPLYVETGKAYLAGPYEGAPLSLAVVTPALAGPFDLGNVLVRAALRVDPSTTRITAASDPLPTILQGIPLDLRDIRVSIDREAFTLNPTACRPMSVDSTITAVGGASANPGDRFQVGSCEGLGFAPKLSLKLKGKTTRGAHPSLRAVLAMPKGGANIGRASVALPHSEFLDQAHIKTICTRVQFAERACPPGSVYGRARAITPLLDHPLEGPVYLRSSNHELPDLLADLNGQIHVALDGRIDSVNGGIRTTFEAVPDAPVTKFVLEMKGNAKGLLVNSTNLCGRTHRAIARFGAQNGKVRDFDPIVASGC